MGSLKNKLLHSVLYCELLVFSNAVQSQLVCLHLGRGGQVVFRVKKEYFVLISFSAVSIFFSV